MNLDKIMMGKMPSQGDEQSKTIDFIITENCNLRCKYCYLVGKNDNRKMSIDVAKKAVDYILTNKNISDAPKVIWAMAGGEAFLEIDMIDELVDYIKYKSNELNHHWKDNYTISIGSNGLLYSSPKVQKFLQKNHRNVSVAITIDGTKEKHDGARVFPDGSGSYDKVVENAMLWLKQNPCMQRVTKATFSHDDLPFLKDSVINLWNLGIDFVMANVVFEDVWLEGDDIIFENQLKELADYVLENELWKTKSVRFFDPHIGFPMAEDELNQGFCGSGKHMLAIDCDGKLFPCMRFADFSLNKKKGLSIGDIYNGIDNDKMRAFTTFSVKTISKKECLECEIASMCSYCAGFNYDDAEENTIFKRATNICIMHKANVRACEYFWDKFEKTTGIESLRKEAKRVRNAEGLQKVEGKSLLLMLDDSAAPHCRYIPKTENPNIMSEEIFNKALRFADEFNFTPIFLGDKVPDYTESLEEIAVTSQYASLKNQTNIVVFDEKINNVIGSNEACILLISKVSVNNLYDMITKVKNSFSRINIIIKDINKWLEEELKEYSSQLDKIIEDVVSSARSNKYYDINVLTDLLNLKKMNNCDAGESSFTLAPNGKIYICPAFYLDNPDSYIGSLEEGISIKKDSRLSLEEAPLCSSCDSYQCNRCKYLNLKNTGEINTPSRMQCIISHVERNASRKLQLRLKEENLAAYMEVLPELTYNDPYDKLTSNEII